MQIRTIVLYSLDGRKRRIDFRLGALNVITGRKGTGKSALIRILEYCLGSGETAVPHGVIRDSVSWYGVLLQFRDTRVFVARAEPERGRRSSTKIFLDVGADLEVPEHSSLEQNANTDALVDILTQRLGIANIETQRGAQSTQDPYRITITHALFFNFQRQDEIAKPTLLFHRQDEPFVDSHIRDVLPYFLGAMGEDRLALMQRLRLEKTELRRLEKSLLESSPPDQTDARAEALLQEATAVGLVPKDVAEQSPIQTLRAIDSTSEPHLDLEGLEIELERRRDERESLLAQQRVLRSRIDMLRALNREEVGYDRELDSQKARLRSIEIVRADTSICPVCQQSLQRRLPAVHAVTDAIERLDMQLEGVAASRPRIENTIADLENRRASLRGLLQENQAVVNRLERQTKRLRRHRDALTASAIVRGRIQYYLESLTSAADLFGPLNDQIAVLRASIKEMEGNLSLENVAERMDSSLRYVEDDMTKWARELDLEYQTHVRLDERRLTVVADTRTGPVPLSRMGSGANWLGYHVVAYSALHHWFEQNDRPVPRFVFFDQPTQVFYPQDSDDPSAFINDDDRRRVDRLFRFLLQLPRELNGEVQVIVTDHALLGFAEFDAAIIENWHSEDALVPADWPKVRSEP